MMRLCPDTLASLVCAVVMAGCNAGGPPQDAEVARSSSAGAGKDVHPADPAADAARPGSLSAGALPSNGARLDGFGPLRLGMTAREAAAAWPGLFAGDEGADSRRTCFHAAVGLPYFTLMFDDGRFVRYDSGNVDVAAPGGGRRGMAEAGLQRLYRGTLQASPHRFSKGGKYLAFDTSGVAPSRLVFETDAGGVVTEWRVGLHPQVDYTEACESDG